MTSLVPSIATCVAIVTFLAISLVSQQACSCTFWMGLNEADKS